MNNAKYPPLEFYQGQDSPYQKIRSIQDFPIVKRFFKGEYLVLQGFSRGFFTKKKRIEAVIEKVNGLNRSALPGEPHADDRFLSITVYKRGEETYKSLLNLGVLYEVITTLGQYSKEQFEIQLLKKVQGIGSSMELDFHRNSMSAMTQMRDTATLLEAMFVNDQKPI